MEKSLIDDKQHAKAANFHRIIAPRVQMVLDDLRKIGNGGERSRYAYTEAEKTKMFKAIRAAVDKAEAAYSPPHKDQELFEF